MLGWVRDQSGTLIIRGYDVDVGSTVWKLRVGIYSTVTYWMVFIRCLWVCTKPNHLACYVLYCYLFRGSHEVSLGVYQTEPFSLVDSQIRFGCFANQVWLFTQQVEERSDCIRTRQVEVFRYHLYSLSCKSGRPDLQFKKRYMENLMRMYGNADIVL